MKKQTYLKKAEKRLSELDEKLNEIKRQIAAKSFEAGHKFRRQLDALRVKREEIQELLNHLKAMDAEYWEETLNELELRMYHLRNSVQHLGERLKAHQTNQSETVEE
ncbi:MAG: hypothetical protein KDH97_04050 [Calditrichaeota bacterium]|nr:hypothetical protein [Calditrichota bacterium]MCB0303697.1 hypothetical protein [Calditrichota bacterium]